MKRIINYCSILFIFAILSNMVLAQELKIFENEEISLEYPSNWGVYEVPNSTANTIFFTAPGWSQENGGTIIGYSLFSFPGSYDTLNERNKEEYTKGVLEGMKKKFEDEGIYDEIEIVASEIISVGNFTALKIDLNLHAQSILLKQRAIIISDGDRYHALTYVAKSNDYSDSINLFDDVVKSFKIKQPHEIPVGYVNLANQRTFIYASFVIYLLLTIFGIFKLVKTKDSKFQSKIKNAETYKNIAKKANIAMWIGIIGNWFFGIKILFYLFLISIFALLICSILLIDTKERKFAIINILGSVIFLIAFVVGYLIGFVS